MLKARAEMIVEDLKIQEAHKDWIVGLITRHYSEEDLICSLQPTGVTSPNQYIYNTLVSYSTLDSDELNEEVKCILRLLRMWHNSDLTDRVEVGERTSAEPAAGDAYWDNSACQANPIDEDIILATEPEGQETGTKFDQDKPDLSLLPTVALVQTSLAFMDGQKKYGRGQYKKGMEARRLVAAALRHILAWKDGEDVAADSKVHHLGHAMANLMMLTELENIGKLIGRKEI